MSTMMEEDLGNNGMIVLKMETDRALLGNFKSRQHSDFSFVDTDSGPKVLKG